MKKFERLPPQQRRQEIQQAALRLFQQKGFAATTMENIISEVSLSKGGVYRIYPSTSAILGDLMLAGMHLRNAFYEETAKKAIAEGKTLDLPFLMSMIVDSMLLYPEFSSVYVEFLWEKQRNTELEAIYQDICKASVEETRMLMVHYHAAELVPNLSETLGRLAELMNAAILSIHVLHLYDSFAEQREQICKAMMDLINI